MSSTGATNRSSMRSLARRLPACENAGTRTLIIDIRANPGGDDDVWIEGIMPYLATRSFSNGSSYRLKIIEGRQKEGQKVGDIIHSSRKRNTRRTSTTRCVSKARCTC